MLKTVKNIIKKKRTIKGIKCLANYTGSDLSAGLFNISK